MDEDRLESEGSEIQLVIPYLSDLAIPDSSLPGLAKNPAIVAALEKLCASWEADCTRIIDNDLPIVSSF